MRRRLSTVLLSTLLIASAGHAQRREVAQTVTLDVIGPRSAASVRRWLTAEARALDACRGPESALVVLALAIAPDGSLLRVEAREDPGANPTATACVVGALGARRMPGRATSVTTVSWALRLPAQSALRCHCFGWVHGPDHGTSCSTTAAACAAERRATTRDTTPCREVVGRATCEDEAFIDGARMVRP